MFKFDVRVKMERTDDKVESAINYAQYIIDNQVIKDSNFYVPTDQHYLEESALINSNVGSGKVVWQTPYVRRLYYNPQYDFSADINPNARGLWFEAAKSDKGKKWIEQGEKAVRSKM